MKNSKGVSLIALIITIIVIIILAAIVMQASTDTVGNAQYAKFAQEFGDYAQKVQSHAAEVNSKNSIDGVILNSAQQYYMVATGLSKGVEGDGEYKMLIPIGYKLKLKDGTETQKKVLMDLLGAKNSGDMVAYVIGDGHIPGYETSGTPSKDAGKATKKFYGDANGDEYHFVTSKGNVFTLPGFPVSQTDGTVEYHIDTEQSHFYTITGSSGKNYGNEAKSGDEKLLPSPISATKLKEAGTYGMTAEGKPSGDANGNGLNKNAYKIG